jgi:hypothetical protein
MLPQSYEESMTMELLDKAANMHLATLSQHSHFIYLKKDV